MINGMINGMVIDLDEFDRDLTSWLESGMMVNGLGESSPRKLAVMDNSYFQVSDG